MPPRPTTRRPSTIGPPTGPTPPFPLHVSGKVISGFGRGSKELGIPTANIPVAGLSVGGHDDVESGVYFGWAGLIRPLHQDGETVAEPAQVRGESIGTAGDAEIYPMVMSIGWNPFYKNTVRSVEVHVLAHFPSDFYGAHLNLLILGFIRPEYDYVDKDSLVEDIMTDCDVARKSLQREGWGWEKWEKESTAGKGVLSARPEEREGGKDGDVVV